jgi:hypothetical protein
MHISTQTEYHILTVGDCQGRENSERFFIFTTGVAMVTAGRQLFLACPATTRVPSTMLAWQATGRKKPTISRDISQIRKGME